MALPIVAAGAVGSTLLILIAVVLIFVVTEPSETMFLAIAAVAMAYLFMR